MSAPPVRCKSNSAALFFTLAAPPDSGKRPPPSASRAGSVRACQSIRQPFNRAATIGKPSRRKRTRRHHRKRRPFDRAGSVRRIPANVSERRKRASRPPFDRGEHRTRRAAGSVPPDSGKPWRPFDRAPPVSLSGKPSATIERAAGFVTIGSGQPFDRAGSVPPDSGDRAPRPASGLSAIPANIGTPPPSEAGNRSTAPPDSPPSPETRRKRPPLRPPAPDGFAARPAAPRPCKPVSSRLKASASPAPIPASRPPVYPATVCRVPLPACQRFDRAPPVYPATVRPRRATVATVCRLSAIPANIEHAAGFAAPVSGQGFRRPCAACQSVTIDRAAGSERRHHRKRRPFDRAGSVRADSGQCPPI